MGDLGRHQYRMISADPGHPSSMENVGVLFSSAWPPGLLWLGGHPWPGEWATGSEGSTCALQLCLVPLHLSSPWPSLSLLHLPVCPSVSILSPSLGSLSISAPLSLFLSTSHSPQLSVCLLSGCLRPPPRGPPTLLPAAAGRKGRRARAQPTVLGKATGSLLPFAVPLPCPHPQALCSLHPRWPVGGLGTPQPLLISPLAPKPASESAREGGSVEGGAFPTGPQCPAFSQAQQSPRQTLRAQSSQP